MKFVKKLTALFLAICMVMAMGITSLAAGTTATKGTSYDLTITNPVTGHKYVAYQLLVGDVAGLENGSGTLSNVEKGSAAIESKTADEIIAALKNKTSGELSTEAYKYINTTKGGTELTEANVTVDGESKTVKKASVVAGYYVIVDESQATLTGDDVVYSRNVVAVVGDTEMTVKVQAPELDKIIADADADPNAPIDGNNKKTDTAAIGDTINFKITSKVPDYTGYTKYFYIINDTMDAGLSFDASSVVVKVNGQVVNKFSDGEGAYYLYTKDTNPSVTTGKTFEIAFKNIKDYKIGDSIEVTYNATVNKDASIGTTANKNTASLTYTNNPNQSGEGVDEPENPNKPGTPNPDKTIPSGETPDKTTKTYVTEINLRKVDQDGMPLTGAEFQLSGTNLNKILTATDYTFAEDTKGAYWKLKDGTYTTAAPKTEVKDGDGNVTQESNEDLYESTETKYSRTTTYSTTTTTASDSKVTMKVDANGYVTFSGLNAGEYTLTETKTPAGYNTISPITFKIEGSTNIADADKGINGGDITWTCKLTSEGTPDFGTITDGKIYADIENVKGSILPSTGGMGTTLIYVAGIAMIVAAGIVVIVRKRMA